MLDDLPSNKTFDVAQDGRQIRGREDRVEVSIENNPSVDLKAFMKAAIFERADNHIAAGRRGKHREPLDYG